MPACARPGTYVLRQTHDCDAAVLVRRHLPERHGLTSVEPLHAGVFTVVQRFRSDLGLYVHLHYLVTDGAFERDHRLVALSLAAALRPIRSRSRRPKPSEVALQLHQTARVRGPSPLPYSTRRQNSRMNTLNRARMNTLNRAIACALGALGASGRKSTATAG